MSAEYILSGGNMQVMLCERGIRTYETATRNTFDINAIPVLKDSCHLPVDRRSGARHRHVAACRRRRQGRGGRWRRRLMLEVHPDPARAWSDGAQSLTFERFAKLMEELRLVAQAVGREI
jgi:3-deoxy-7-phosphoheptulonate synthase